MDIWQRLTSSPSVRQQQVAFSCATGLPLTLLPASGNGNTGKVRSPLYCVDGCMGTGSGELCKERLLATEHRATEAGHTMPCQCPAGLVKLVTPVVINGQHVGNLLAGPFALSALDATRLQKWRRELKKWGLESRIAGLRSSWQSTPRITEQKLQALKTLLEMFAQYLAECGQRLLLEEAGRQSPLLQKIESELSSQGEHALTVRELADRLNVSPCYFCKLFRKQTGLTFTEYRIQLKVEAAKRLLLNRNLRVSEVAFEAGFDSIPYFNRAFRRLVGCSPSQFRSCQDKSD